MKLSVQRHDVVFTLLAGGLVALGAWLGTMIHRRACPSTPKQEEIARQVDRAQAGQKIVLPLPARPGNIYARCRRSSVLAAGSRQVPGCFVDVALLSPEELGEVACRLADALQADPGPIYQTLSLRRDKRFVWIAREITPQQADAVRAIRCRAVGIQYEWRREYPNGRIAGTVVGYCRKDGQPGGGLELTAREILEPHDGKRVVLGDAYRRAIWLDREESIRPQDGRNICLSLDVIVQGYLQEAVAETVRKYGAEWGTGVVVNPWTGDILAMCSAPEYDPNKYNRTSADEMLNRAITCPYEPGSVFKPIIAAAAVEAGDLTYETRIDCENGVYQAARGGRISDHGQRYGVMNLRDVVVHSSNIGMAKVGERMGNRELWRALDRWGFGRRTGIVLPGETAGIVRPLQRWDGYSLRRVPFGQEVSTSTLQLAMAFSAIANGGLLMRPRLVQQVVDPQNASSRTLPPKVVRRVLSESAAQQTRRVMEDVILRGTGKECRLSLWGSWGKTGTAQVPGPHGYIEDAYVASFVGGAPVEQPAVVCLISIYRPDRRKGYYGGAVAAPAVKEVLEKTLTYLNIPPDRPTEQVAAKTRAEYPSSGGRAALGAAHAGTNASEPARVTD